MKNLIIATTALALFAGSAFAGGKHKGGHDEEDAKLAVGEPGKHADASKTINVKMMENDEGQMLYEPATLDVEKGQTIHFVIKNVGELEHEFVLDTHEILMEHKETMAKFPDMEHDDPNSIRLEPGKSGEITWKFSNSGKFEFACLIPGHYESGMKGDVAVVEKAASN